MSSEVEEIRVQVEIWSDVACPWCAVGKRRFERALAAFDHADRVAVRWRSFELDPDAPAVDDGDYLGRLATKYGVGRADARAMVERMTAVAAEEGWRFRFDRIRPGNTFDAHRLLQLAADRGVQGVLAERLFAAYLEDGEPIGDRAVLGRLAAGAGLDAEEVGEVLAGDRYAADVRADERLALQLRITAVPCFVLDRRSGVAGAQPPEVLGGALARAWAASEAA